MVSFEEFDFATPVFTKGDWFLQTAQKNGFHFLPGRYNIYEPWTEDDPHDKLRVSLIINPCTWLSQCYLTLKGLVSYGSAAQILQGHIAEFCCLDTSTPHTFTEDYLKKLSGGISNLFLKYKADTIMRVEDLPHAFCDFADAFARPGNIINALYQGIQIPKNLVPYGLRSYVAKAEGVLGSTYDYW